ncbi:MAG TPA: hypothetical protein VED40_12375 [Azospirillaceae bacterium]|nr:hypothetical protein [Azospirillaceae bacterium]
MATMQETMRALRPAVLLFVVGLGLTGAAALRLPDDAAGAAVLFPPSLSSSEIVQRLAAADARPVRSGAWGLWIVAGDRPGLADRLRRAGAWLLLNPAALSSCLPPGVSATTAFPATIART